MSYKVWLSEGGRLDAITVDVDRVAPLGRPHVGIMKEKNKLRIVIRCTEMTPELMQMVADMIAKRNINVIHCMIRMHGCD